MPNCRPMARSVLVLAVGAAMLGGCATRHEQTMPASLPPPPPQLVAAGSLELARDCEVRDGVVYRADFVVQGDGRVADVRPDPAPACVRVALVAWLDGFRYAPSGASVPMTIDWMQVSARRSY